MNSKVLLSLAEPCEITPQTYIVPEVQSSRADEKNHMAACQGLQNRKVSLGWQSKGLS